MPKLYYCCVVKETKCWVVKTLQNPVLLKYIDKADDCYTLNKCISLVTPRD